MNTPKRYIEDRLDELERNLARLEKENSSLKKKIEGHKKLIAYLLDEYTKLSEYLGDKKIFSTPPASNTQQRPPTRTVALENFQSPLRPPNQEKTTLPPSKPQAVDSPQEDLVRRFNRLSRIRLSDPTGRQFADARKIFFRENSCVGLSCNNTNERMNNPKVSPVFLAAKPVQSCDLWVVPVDENRFSALPNPQNVYNDNLHLDRALCVVFESGFIEGNTYDNILVERPAQFEKRGEQWHFLKQWKLILE